jgi:hypothetical protein
MSRKYELKLKLTRSELITLECLLRSEQWCFDEIAQGFNEGSKDHYRMIKPLTTERACQLADMLEAIEQRGTK